MHLTIRAALVAAVVLAALVVAGSAPASLKRWDALNTQEKVRVVKREIRKHESTIRWVDHRWMQRRSVAHGLGSWTYWPEHAWRVRQANVAALAKARHALVGLRYLSLTRDWLTAIQIVQRAFPGSAWWLRSCSSSEGGHGAWVPNRQGSGAGGWMQYMSGTFWHDYNAAAAYLRSRGWAFPAAAASWYSPLGQAIAAGWAYGHDRPGGKWTGSGC